jgi:ABC-2 type transport system permease protein
MSTLRVLMRHEWRNVFNDRALLLGVAVFLLLGAYALFSGARWVETRTTEGALAMAETSARNNGFRDDLQRVESGAVLDKPSWYPRWIRLPTTPDSRAVLPTSPLAALATNAGDLQPYIGRMRTASSRYALFEESNAATQNPVSLVVGRFDLAFLLTAVLPLLLLASCFDLLSAERERGTLAMVLAQPVRARTLVLGKAIVRGAVSVLPALLLLGVGLPLTNAAPLTTQDWLDLSLLGLLVVVYAAFWLGLAALVNARRRSSAHNALTLGVLWLLLVLVVPSLLNVAAAVLRPPPDRAELTNALRSTLVEADKSGRRFVSDYNLEHPDRPVTSAPGGGDAWDSAPGALRSWLVRQRVDTLVAPLATQFDQRLKAQQQFAESTRFASPALVFHVALTRLAGTDAPRTRVFHQAVQSHLDAWRAQLVPLILSGRGCVRTACGCAQWPRQARTVFSAFHRRPVVALRRYACFDVRVSANGARKA